MPRNGMINPLNALSTKLVDIQSIKNSSRGKKAPRIKPNINIMPSPLNLNKFNHESMQKDVSYIAKRICLQVNYTIATIVL
jgi:hypothetical protein